MTSEKTGRRGFFARALKAMGLFGAGGFFYSAYRFMTPGDLSRNPPLRSKDRSDNDRANGGPGSRRAGSASPDSLKISARTLPPGASQTVAIGYAPVIVVHGEGGFKAFNATCSHLGCLVRWDNAAKIFRCPCHAGTYGPDGRVLSGPPPADLRPCRVEIGDDTLTISIG